MKMPSYIPRRVVLLCMSYSFLVALPLLPAAGTDAVPKSSDVPVPASSPAAMASELKQLHQQAKTADQLAATRKSPPTDAQLADRILLEEKVLIANQRLVEAARLEPRAPSEMAAAKQLTDELQNTSSSEERAAIIARHRAYRRVLEKAAPRSEIEKEKVK